MDLHRAVKPRPRSELVMHLVRPLALRGVAWLAELRVDPQHVVLTHGALGLAAAGGIALGGTPALWAAAACLIAKVVLDNVDGGLARATDRVTLSGRYLDTLVDSADNLALLVALASFGPTAAAIAAFPILTIVLTVDYNLERLYKEARAIDLPAGPAPGTPPEPSADVPIGAPEPVYRVLRGTYEALFAPQDRMVEAVDQRFGSALAHRAGIPFDRDARRAWNDLFSTAAHVNLGLSTQLVALALALAVGQPFLWVWFVIAQAGWLLCVALLRAARFRAYLRTR